MPEAGTALRPKPPSERHTDPGRRGPTGAPGAAPGGATPSSAPERGARRKTARAVGGTKIGRLRGRQAPWFSGPDTGSPNTGTLTRAARPQKKAIQTAKLRKRTCSGAGTRVEERLEAGVTNKHDEGPDPRGPTNRSPETCPWGEISPPKAQYQLRGEHSGASGSPSPGVRGDSGPGGSWPWSGPGSTLSRAYGGTERHGHAMRAAR
ncbi:hypothetical protein NDU88_006462 [Pleurodeles waltl]|uniref:Uncharacterized protein n=1 Tax=Pleurodeles waltl TaxID=8319 RepID=A0AAV7QL71_PLEWA|nr:hypothetical protein NDU88_006462 [Pleurodeles waltl]